LLRLIRATILLRLAAALRRHCVAARLAVIGTG
jgi:hypothetical protein